MNYFVLLVFCLALCIALPKNDRRGKGNNRKPKKHKDKKHEIDNESAIEKLEEELKQLKELVEDLPKNVVNVHMHTDGSDVSSGGNATRTHDHYGSEDDPVIHMHLNIKDDPHHYHHGSSCHKNDEYHAHCEVMVNSNMPDADPITGYVHMVQKGDGPVDVFIKMTGFDMTKENPVHSHGFHIHQYGDISDSCDSLGSHFNPSGRTHGSMKDHSHAGDLGNIHCDMNGDMNVHKSTNKISLHGRDSVIGRGVVIHEGPDDLGKDGGNAGGKMACCIIASADPAMHQHDHGNVTDTSHIPHHHMMNMDQKP
mgnify:CR=1 FL=1